MSDLTAIRRVLRRVVPFPVRWRARVLRRLIVDARSGARFGAGLGAQRDFSHRVCGYERPLICYAGQEGRFAAKKHNVELALSCVDGLVVAPGETFSFWRCVQRATVRSGYAAAAALKDGVLVDDVGGAICLASTLLFNIGLLSGMAIDERWCHSVDSYGDARYFELGRDAAVEYAYRDLRLRNVFDAPMLLRAWVSADAVCAEAWSSRPADIQVNITVSAPECDGVGVSVTTVRQVSRSGTAHTHTEDRSQSTYRVAPVAQDLRTTN